MKVLVACEESQVVCKAFRAKGHEAYSCDILQCSGGHPEWHIQDDVLNVLKQGGTPQVPSRYPVGWDLMIAHPPCTYLANSGVSHLYNKDKTINQERWEKMKMAAHFFQKLWLCDIPKVCIENPIMHGYGKAEAGIRFCYDAPEFKQVIQPWMFGEDASKATCLWLRNLPKLISTDILPGGRKARRSNQTASGQNKLGPSPTRAAERARTYPKIAEAMADQWGCLK
jgi:hypothetical protein